LCRVFWLGEKECAPQSATCHIANPLPLNLKKKKIIFPWFIEKYFTFVFNSRIHVIIKNYYTFVSNLKSEWKQKTDSTLQ